MKNASSVALSVTIDAQKSTFIMYSPESPTLIGVPAFAVSINSKANENSSDGNISPSSFISANKMTSKSVRNPVSAQVPMIVMLPLVCVVLKNVASIFSSNAVPKSVGVTVTELLFSGSSDGGNS